MVYCPNCGTVNRDDALYCNECGGEIRFDGLSQPKKEVRQPEIVPTSNPNKRSKRRHQTNQNTEIETSVKMLSIVACCIPFAGFGLYFTFRDDPDPRTPRTMLFAAILGSIFYLIAILSNFH